MIPRAPDWAGGGRPRFHVTPRAAMLTARPEPPSPREGSRFGAGPLRGALQLTKPRPSPSPPLPTPNPPPRLSHHPCLLTPPNPQFLCARWSFPTSGKATAEGLPQSNRSQAPNPAQLPGIPPLLPPTPTHSPSARPLLLSSISSSHPVLSLHPSLPAQRAHTLLPTPRRPRSFPRLPPPGPSAGPQDLDHGKLWDCPGLGCCRHNQIHKHPHIYREIHRHTPRKQADTVSTLTG